MTAWPARFRTSVRAKAMMLALVVCACDREPTLSWQEVYAQAYAKGACDAIEELRPELEPKLRGCERRVAERVRRVAEEL
jgi:hypothetical protein